MVYSYLVVGHRVHRDVPGVDLRGVLVGDPQVAVHALDLPSGDPRGIPLEDPLQAWDLLGAAFLGVDPGDAVRSGCLLRGRLKLNIIHIFLRYSL